MPYDLQPTETIIEEINPSVLSTINPYTKRVLCKKGESLFSADELKRYFYIVVRGKIKSYQLNLNNAKEQTIFIFRRGDMFDTIILLDGKPHDVMYKALEDSELLQLPIEKVRELLATDQNFNKIFFPYLARQMRSMEETATDLSLYSTSERLIKLLIENIDPGNMMKYDLLQGLSHTEIAKLIGTVRHVVERHLKALKEEGTIDVKNKKLQILDAKKLLEKINLF